jgi:uncharacterized Zn-finger protein
MSDTNTIEKSPVIRVSIDTKQVFCPPKDAELWSQHPRVYIDMTDKAEVNCPYCGNIFTKK